jgi:muconolactone delta-isomerase
VDALPVDPAERTAVLSKVSEMTKKAMDEGKILDWGIFPGGNGGYSVAEGTAADVLGRAMQRMPYFKFETKQVLSIAEVGKVMQSLQG